MQLKNIFQGFDSEKVLETITKQNLNKRIAVTLLGILLVAGGFNLFFVPQNIATNGISGLGVLFSQTGFITPATFILFANAIIILISIFALPKKNLVYNISGAALFSLAVYLTQDISSLIHLDFDNQLLYVLTGSVVTGFGSGLIFKSGFTSGGTDVLGAIVSRYTKQPVGKCLLAINIIIMLMGGVVLGVTMIVYILINTYISSLLIDKIMIGISESKMFIIDSRKHEEIRGKGTLENARLGLINLNKYNVFTSISTDLSEIFGYSFSYNKIYPS